jgi:competence protein ComEA
MKKIIFLSAVLSMSSLFAMSLTQLNSASKADLMKINGIGEAKAEAIIKARAKGKFKSYDELLKVKGIGNKITSNLKNDVVSKKTTAKVVKKSKTKIKTTKNDKKITKKIEKSKNDKKIAKKVDMPKTTSTKEN